MPTARPSIRASVRLALATSVKLAENISAATESSTPTTALISGMPAASSDPNVTIRTIAAKASPNTSVIDGPKEASWKTCPVKATCRCAFSPMEAVFCSASSVADFTPASVEENWTETIAER